MARIVAHNSAGYLDEDGTPVFLAAGQEVDLPPEAEERLDAEGALVPEGVGSLEEFNAAKLDAYRGPRGDQIANQAHAQRLQGGGAILDLSEPGSEAGEEAGLVDRIRAGLTVDETVALAQGDPQRAPEVLQAEHEANGGEPRKGVVDGLEKLKAE